ncbi:MAG: hypothetical protein LBU14_05610 [Candidatus Peribacteria bacterium]|jgi:hypothetical protein|nr:hypothetical protein [Candidatus Peribacteria bacterium]
MNEIDILNEIDASSSSPFYENEVEKNQIIYVYETIVNEPKKRNKLFSIGIFAFKYFTTSFIIFAILLISTNYSAYMNIAKSYLMPEQAEEIKNSILNSVDAAKVSDIYQQQDEELDFVNVEENIKEQLSINKYKRKLDFSAVNLDIDITTLENRVIIPKIGKNIPLIDIKNRSISGYNELNDIFMEELENGVIRYPGSAKP